MVFSSFRFEKFLPNARACLLSLFRMQESEAISVFVRPQITPGPFFFFFLPLFSILGGSPSPKRSIELPETRHRDHFLASRRASQVAYGTLRLELSKVSRRKLVSLSLSLFAQSVRSNAIFPCRFAVRRRWFRRRETLEIIAVELASTSHGHRCIRFRVINDRK